MVVEIEEYTTNYNDNNDSTMAQYEIALALLRLLAANPDSKQQSSYSSDQKKIKIKNNFNKIR